MIDNFVILSSTEIVRYKNKPWFSTEVFKLVSSCGYESYLVPKSRLEEESSELLDELIEDFEWDKVKRIMEELNWTWWGNDNPPTIEEMKEMVRGLYSSIENRVENNEYCFCSSGGFKLTFNPDEDNELSLVFEAVTGAVYK